MPVDFQERRETLLKEKCHKAEKECARLRAMLLERGMTNADDRYADRVALAPWNTGEWELYLTPKEKQLMDLLYYRRGKILTKEAILGHIYSHDADWPDSTIIDVFVCKLRKKLSGHAGIIENVYARGYRYQSGIADTIMRKEGGYSPTGIIRPILFQNAGEWVSMETLIDAIVVKEPFPNTTSYRQDIMSTLNSTDEWVERNCPPGTRLERKFILRRDPLGRSRRTIDALRLVIPRG